jgi:hypothetical protein
MLKQNKGSKRIFCCCKIQTILFLSLKSIGLIGNWKKVPWHLPEATEGLTTPSSAITSSALARKQI